MLKNIFIKIIKLIIKDNFFYEYLNKYLDELRDKKLKERLKSCGKKIRLRQPIVIESPGYVEIGNNVSFASFVHIWGRGGVKIGDNTMIASHVAITSSGHKYEYEKMHETAVHKKIEIGKDVWIGSHSTILPGVKIGDGAVVGANTLVKDDVPKKSIFVGNPGRVIKYRKIQ